jgi:hypothetical protein
MSGFRFLEPRCYGFYSSRTWRCVAGWSVPDISRQRLRLQVPQNLVNFQYLKMRTVGWLEKSDITVWRVATSQTSRYNWLRCLLRTLPQFPSCFLSLTSKCSGTAVALRYKPAGRGFDSRGCHWNFSVAQTCRSHYGRGVDTNLSVALWPRGRLSL